MNEGNCCYCNSQIEGMFVSAGAGKKSHPHCFERKHKPEPAVTMYQVARGHYDPVLAAEVIEANVPADIAATVVYEYNRRLLAAWEGRCSP